MQALYTVADIVAATGGRAANVADGAISAISIDSRDVSAGALFVAIKGERFDGHDFVAKAIEAGATAALVSEDRADVLGGLPLIIVPEALAGLVDLARFSRARSTAKIFAVTGSAGKTSTKDALAAICASEGRTHAAIKSFNNHWGVPLMLARLPADAQFGVFEIGMNHAGEISPLVQLVRPQVALITSIAPAHIEFLGSLEAIARAKSEIFDGLEPGGTAIVNADHDQLETIRKLAAEKGVSRIITYGYADGADVRIAGVSRAETGLQGNVTGDGLDLFLQTSFAGRHHFANAVGALLAARAAGVAPDRAMKIIAGLHEGAGRGAITRLGDKDRQLVLVDESFNANPGSMAAALEVFSTLAAPAGQKILVIGDMLELGEAGRDLHEGLETAVRNAGADKIFLIGPQMRHLREKLSAESEIVHADTIEELRNTIVTALDYGDLVMVKGSKGIGLAPLVEEIRARFNPSAS